MKPNYYAIIPAGVRYDKRLSPNEKLLYAELTALSFKEGYAWVHNKFLSGIFEVSPRSITRWIANLQSCGYISSTVSKNDGNVRKIVIVEAQVKEKSATEMSIPIDTSVDPIDKNVHTHIDNIYNINTTKNNTSNNINNPPISPHEKNEDWKAAWGAFIEMRKKKKSPLTDRAKTLILNKLKPYSKNEQVEMLNEAIIHNWLSVYPRDPPKSSKENNWEGVTRL